MRLRRSWTLAAVAAVVILAATAGWCARHAAPHPVADTDTSPTLSADSQATTHVRVDSVSAEDETTRYSALTQEDFEKVAEELGVEVAAIHAVVDIECGGRMKGFWAPGVPIINFDKAMYNRYKAKTKCAGAKDATVPKGLSGYAQQEWHQLVTARRTNEDAANLGTFWGMFQIGGFNYRLCGCESIGEFVSLMSYSELEQLELFAAFITNAGMLEDLRNKNWAGFARKYNGASYARRGYHTRMANAYAKYKK